jgi:hypothetical protein
VVVIAAAAVVMVIGSRDWRHSSSVEQDGLSGEPTWYEELTADERGRLMGWRVRRNPTYRDVLPGLIADATAANRSGMLVILARTADARQWHHELTTDWTSIHDVTGRARGVICPNPSARGTFGMHNGSSCRTAVLMLSLREKVALLVRLPDGGSIYQLCKLIAIGVGDDLERYIDLIEEREGLRGPLFGCIWESATVSRWRERLAVAKADPPYDEIRALAEEIAATAGPLPMRPRWRRLDRKANKVLAAVDRARSPRREDLPPPPPRRPTPHNVISEQVRVIEEQHKAVEEELSKLNRALRFADTVQMAAAQQLRDPVVLIQEGSQGLQGWQVRTIAERACGPIELKPRAS